MKTLTLLSAIATVLIGAIPGGAGEQAWGNYKISEPYTHEKLSIYIIEGADAVESENLITLEFALENKLAVIHETGEVGELTVENKSDRPLFINAGDIVKGGMQDRYLRYDMIVSAGSGKVPVPSFCVEQGRWSKRGNEDEEVFSASKNVAPYKDIKLSAKEAKSQTEVWDNIAKVSSTIAHNSGLEIRGGRTGSMLFFVDDAKMDSARADYAKTLEPKLADHGNALGFAYAINGKLNSIDIYRSHALFEQMWPKLIKAAAIEAISSPSVDSIIIPTTLEVAAWLDCATNTAVTEEEVEGSMHLKVRNQDSDISFETYNINDSVMIHLNVLKK